MVRASALFVALALATSAAVASAETGEPVEEPDEAAPAAAPDRTAWLIVEGGIGVNGVTDDEFLGPVDMGLHPLVGLGAAAYLRPLEYLSAGVQLYYGLLLPHSEEVDAGAGGFLVVSAFARAQYGFGRFEPWVGLGLGYGQAHAGATGPRATQAGSVALHALALDVSAGLSVEVADRLTLGPFLRFVFGLWASGCQSFPSWPFDVDEDGCEGIEPFYGHELPRLPHLWVVGVEAAYWVL